MRSVAKSKQPVKGLNWEEEVRLCGEKIIWPMNSPARKFGKTRQTLCRGQHNVLKNFAQLLKSFLQQPRCQLKEMKKVAPFSLLHTSNTDFNAHLLGQFKFLNTRLTKYQVISAAPTQSKTSPDVEEEGFISD